MRLRTDDLTWQELDGEIVVLDLESSKYYVINGSGARLWERLSTDEVSTDELARELESRYALTPTTAQEHAREFVDDLRHKGLLAP